MAICLQVLHCGIHPLVSLPRHLFRFRSMGVLTLYNIEERGSDIEASVQNLERAKLDYEVIKGDDLTHRLPGLQSDSDFTAVLDKEAGLLKADTCLIALQVIT